MSRRLVLVVFAALLCAGCPIISRMEAPPIVDRNEPTYGATIRDTSSITDLRDGSVTYLFHVYIDGAPELPNKDRGPLFTDVSAAKFFQVQFGQHIDVQFSNPAHTWVRIVKYYR